MKITFLPALILFVIFTCPCLRGADYFPDGGFRASTPEEQGMDSEKIVRLIDWIRENRMDVHGFLVVRNGYLVAEANFFPHQKGYKHVLHSCTKSVTSALIGIARGEGLIGSIDDPVLGYFKDRKVDASDPRKRALTIRHLLTMSAGVDWTENGSYGGPEDSTMMMFGSPDAVQYILDRPMRADPGKEFYYCTGASHLLSAIIQGASGETELEYAREKLFAPMGITDVVWQSDRNGVTTGGSGLYLAQEDLAKFGYLYLKKGKWKDRQIVPREWVEESTVKKMDTPRGLAGRFGYGYQWWMNGFGGYSARGLGGQYLFVLPELNLVAVFTSGLTGPAFFFPETACEYFIAGAVKSDGPLPPNPQMGSKLDSLLKKISAPPAEAGRRSEPTGLFPHHSRAALNGGRPRGLEDGDELTRRFTFDRNFISFKTFSKINGALVKEGSGKMR